MTSHSHNTNLGSSDLTLSGLYYCYLATGGYSMEKGFSTLSSLVNESGFNLFDVTNAVQLTLDVKAFNERLGIYKDASNKQILSTSFNSQTNRFPVDSITLN